MDILALHSSLTSLEMSFCPQVAACKAEGQVSDGGKFSESLVLCVGAGPLGPRWSRCDCVERTSPSFRKQTGHWHATSTGLSWEAQIMALVSVLTGNLISFIV